MKNQRARKVANYVIPTVLSQCAFFLFTIVDGVFVGNGGNSGTWYASDERYVPVCFRIDEA